MASKRGNTPKETPPAVVDIYFSLDLPEHLSKNALATDWIREVETKLAALDLSIAIQTSPSAAQTVRLLPYRLRPYSPPITRYRNFAIHRE